MKIAILSSIAWRTPPTKYGPWEQVTSNIAEGLIEKDIDVKIGMSKPVLIKANRSLLISVFYNLTEIRITK